MSTDAPAVDLAAVVEDARRRLLELEAERQHLALDALSDDDAAERLKDVASLMTAARDEIEHALLAESEVDRRAVAAKEQEKRDERARLLALADKAAQRLPAASRQVDEAATALARAIARHREIYDDDLALRIQAGVLSQPSGWEPGPAYEAALRHALAAEGCSDTVAFRDPPRGLRGGVAPLSGR